jgi:hypothetical protein
LEHILRGLSSTDLGPDDREIARITTTIDDESNGFRLALIPMALSSPDLAARSILCTTLAIACYHLGRPQEATRYRYRAIRDLSNSLGNMSVDSMDSVTKTRHFAASMMLCVYGVCSLAPACSPRELMEV